MSILLALFYILIRQALSDKQLNYSPPLLLCIVLTSIITERWIDKGMGERDRLSSPCFIWYRKKRTSSHHSTNLLKWMMKVKFHKVFIINPSFKLRLNWFNGWADTEFFLLFYFLKIKTTFVLLGAEFRL